MDLEAIKGLSGVGRMEGESPTNTTDSKWSDVGPSTKKRTKTTIDAANWMKDLDGELYLSALTIPGTHDSHALVGTPLMPDANTLNPVKVIMNLAVDWFAKATKAAECQDWNIATQLQNGVRYFDFRYGDDLRMRHGQLELPGTLPQCLKAVSDFLNTHPQETVIVMAKWDKWGFIDNAGFTEPDTVRTTADKAFTDLTCFQNVTSTPQLKNVRGKIIRKKEGNSTQGLDFDAAKRDSKYNQPAFNRPQYQLSNHLSAEQNTWAESFYTIDGVWAQAEHTLNWIRDVRPKAIAEAVIKDSAETDPNKKTNVTTVNSIWDGTGLNSFRMDLWTILAQSTLFPVTIAKPTNQKLHKWVEANCSLAQRYELGIIQLDFAGSEGTPLLTKLILTNFV